MTNTILKLAKYKDFFTKIIEHIELDLLAGEITVKETLFQDDIKKMIIDSSEGNLKDVRILLQDGIILVRSKGVTNGVSFIAKHGFKYIKMECSEVRQILELRFIEEVNGESFLDKLAIKAAQTVLRKPFLEKILSDIHGVYANDDKISVSFSKLQPLEAFFEKELLGKKLPALANITLVRVEKGRLVFKFALVEEVLEFIDRFLPEPKF